MKKSILLIVGIVAVVLVAVALQLDRTEQPDSAPSRVSQDLTTGLAEKMKNVARIEMSNADGEVTLAKNDSGQWVIEQSEGYRANETQVTQLLANIGTMEVRQRLTQRKEFLPELGLDEPGTPDSRATLVALKDDKGAIVESFVFGNTKFGGGPGGSQSIYVRRADETQAWEVRSSASPSTTVSTWRPREIVNVATNRVRAMEVALHGGVGFQMARPESPEDSFNVSKPSEGWRVRDSVTGDRSVAGFLQSLTMDDVRRAEGFLDTLAEESRLVTQTFDGLEIESIVRKDGDKAYLTLSARYNDALRGGYAESLPEPEPGTPHTIKPAEEVRAEVEEINRLTSCWAYALPNWKFNGIENATRTTILEEIQEDVAAAQILISWEGAPQSTVAGRTQEEAKELAESLKARLDEEGADIFEQLAREHSDDPETAADGGVIGVVTRDDMTEEFTTPLFELETGEVSDVVETVFGYAIIKRITAPEK